MPSDGVSVRSLWPRLSAVVVTVVAALITAGAGGSVAARVAAATKPEETAGCGTSCGACSLRGACEPTA